MTSDVELQRATAGGATHPKSEMQSHSEIEMICGWEDEEIFRPEGPELPKETVETLYLFIEPATEFCMRGGGRKAPIFVFR